MCSSRKASGNRLERLLPIGPVSSARNATTASGASGSRVGGFDRGDDAERAVEAAGGRDAVEMRAGPDARLAAAPKRLPASSRETSSPASRIQPAASSCAASSSGEYAGAMLRDRVDLFEALEDASSRQCSQHAPADEREERDGGEADVPRGRRDERAEEAWVERAEGTLRSVCCRPIAAPLRPWPASSTAAANERLFQLIESTPATTSTGTSTAAARRGARSSGRQAPTRRARSRAAGASRLRADVRPAAGADPRRRSRAPASTASTAAGGARRQAALLVQEEHGEAGDAKLRREQERAADESRQIRRSRSGATPERAAAVVRAPAPRAGRAPPIAAPAMQASPCARSPSRRRPRATMRRQGERGRRSR